VRVDWRRFVPAGFECDWGVDKLAEHDISFEEAGEVFFNSCVMRNGVPTDRRQVMSKTEITSKNQSGGITAQNVSIQGGNTQQTLPPNQPSDKRWSVKKLWTIISAVVFLLAALIAILEYLKISLF
jgi:hypothetical protein